MPSASPTGLKYVALGDSYVAAPLVPVTDVANGCFRSTGNYPSIVAKELGAELDDRSCARRRSERLPAQASTPTYPPQLTALKPGLDLVTVGFGGNDERVFARLVGKCPALRARTPRAPRARTS